jgi:glycosyltransferase involved in cell wall biosynthesis
VSAVVTVMVPSYNYEHYLTECVESATQQEGVELDIVIVENASTDGSLAVARKLADKYDSVRLVVYEDNQGIICSLNRCREEVRGDYAVLLCADDCLTPGSLARSVAFMEAHPEVGLAYGPAIDFADLSEITPDRLVAAEGDPIVYSGADWIARRCKAGSNPIRTPEALMRTSTINSVGLLDPATPHCSDLNMWLRIAAVADVAYLPGPPLALYRKHSTNYSIAFLNWALPDLEQRWTAFQSFFARVQDRPERHEWERSIRHVLGREARYLATRVFAHDQGEDKVAQLMAFADEVDPDGASTVEELGWKVRRKLGPSLARRFPPFLPWPALRRVGRDVAERRRVRTGV